MEDTISKTLLKLHSFSPVKNAFLHFFHLTSRSISNGGAKKERKKKEEKDYQPDLMDCFSIPVHKPSDGVRGCFRRNSCFFGNRPLIQINLSNCLLTGEKDRLPHQSADVFGESLWGR